MKDEYSRHEALHTAWLAADFVERYVYQNPAIEADDECRQLALEAAEKLATIYQRLGQEERPPSLWQRVLRRLVDE